jgi:uncharacterized membrane protein
MFEWLFKYPPNVFAKGTFVLLGSWPHWVLYLALTISAAALAWTFLNRWRLPSSVQRLRTFSLWVLQCTAVALLLLLLWEPAISVAALRPHENIVAVLVDDSRSMAIAESGMSREQQATNLLNSDLLRRLRGRFQVRLYRLGDGVKPANDIGKLLPNEPTTEIGKGLREIADEAQTLPIGSVVLLTDGADTAGGVGLDTLSELRRLHLPVNAVGFGSPELSHDVELDGFSVPRDTLVDSRLQASVSIRQQGFSGQHATLTLLGAGKVLASREVVLQTHSPQTETIEFNAGDSGVKRLQVKLDPLAGEKNQANNQLSSVLSVDGTKRRLLYVEGEPRWEYKFLRRAVEDDRALHIVSMLRTTQNKIYRQGVANSNELANGFPNKPEDLFNYQGLILGSVESGFFTRSQQQLIQEFVDRRGGGLLFLGGRAALADGDYEAQPFSELLPVILPRRKNTFKRIFVAAELTDAGKQSIICRIDEDRKKSNEHWDALPYLADYQDPGTPKPGAVVLADVRMNGNRLPLLITENYGRGRTGVFATGGSWRWRMQQPANDTSQQTFWRQLLRWEVGATPERVVASTPKTLLQDDGQTILRAEVRDTDYLPTNAAAVTAHLIAPDGSAEEIPLRPDPTENGVYAAEWNAGQTGTYVADVIARRGDRELGRDVLAFQREDGIAENFHTEQNRDLLKQLANDTGGKYYTSSDANALPDEIAYSEAGISAREIKDLWDMPAIFILILLLLGSQWLLRRKSGAI